MTKSQGKRHIPPREQQIRPRMLAIIRAKGVCRPSDMPDVSSSCISKAADRGIKLGEMFRYRCGMLLFYFATAQARDEFAAQHLRPLPAKKAPKKGSRAGWGEDDPEYLPKNPDGTPAYKVTRCPGFDRDPSRSNTHPM